MSDRISTQIAQLLPRLRGFARSLTRNRADADDLVQQTCERALTAIDSFAPGTRLDSWLFRIMHNAWIDTTRRRRPTADIDDAAVSETLMGEDGRRTTEARLSLSAVETAIAALPEDQRSVLVLVCVEGLRYREVAEVLDIPIGTVMSRLARARAAITDALEGGDATKFGTGGATT